MSDVTGSGLANALRDRYTLERELGRGGMATVWLGRDLKHDRLVAIKMLRPELWAALGAERFLREIRVTANLQHPHILPLFDSGEADGLVFYVMPYVNGESLRDRLRREPQLSLETALRIASEAARALEHAHREGIVHRDVKPENLLLAQDGTTLVADFGVARAVTAGSPHLTETGIALGTPAYMSPEQAAGDPTLDARSDQYALACVVYEMLAGEPPFTGPNAQAIIARRLTQPAPPLGAIREVPPAVTRTVSRALSKSPADRFPSMGAFAQALGAAEPTEMIPRARRGFGGGGPRLVAAGVGLLLLLAAAGLVLTRRTAHGASDLLPGRVVIAPFDNRTGDATLDQVGIMVADWLTQGLSSTPLVDVVDSRSLLASVQAVRQAGAGGDPALALARETRSGTVVAGSVFRAGDSLRFQARVTDAGSGKLRLTVDPVTIPAADPVLALEPLRRRVTGALASLLDDRLNNPGVATSRPPTYEAYQEFVLGMETYSRDIRADLAHFARAVALDSTYAQALLWLGIAHADAGEIGPADSIFTLAESRRDHLAPYDQANLEYFAGLVRGDRNAAYRGATRMLGLAPGGEHAKWAVALTAMITHRPHEALAMLAKIDTTRGWGRTWRDGIINVTMDALHQLREYDRELALAGRAHNAPDAPPADFVGSQAPALAALGRVDELAALPLERPRDVTPRAGRSLLGVAAELSAHERPDASRRMYLRAARWYRERLAAEREGRAWREGLAYSLLGAGSWAEARERYGILMKEDPTDVTSMGALGVIAARTGDEAAARRALQALSSVASTHRFGEPSWWRARILAILGRNEEAVAAIEQAYREGRDEDYRELLPVGGGHTFHLDEPELAPLRSDPRVIEIFRPKD